MDRTYPTKAQPARYFNHSVDKNCNVNDYQRKSVSDLKQEQQREATKNTTTTSQESPEHRKVSLQPQLHPFTITYMAEKRTMF
jgi:hypothetical protein